MGHKHFIWGLTFFVLFASGLETQAALSCRDIFSPTRSKISASVLNEENNRGRLQARVAQQMEGAPTTIIVLNSLTYNLQGVRRIKGVEYYAARYLGPAVLEVINNPNVRVIYPTIYKISRAEILHYAEPYIQETLAKSPESSRKNLEEDILNRFQVVQVSKGTKGWLAERLLEDSQLIETLKQQVQNRNAYMQVYYTTPTEQRLAQMLEIPIYGSPKKTKIYGSKSGNHIIFRNAQVAHPKAEIRLTSITEMAQGVYNLWSKHQIKQFVVKVDEGASGKGNARFTLDESLVKNVSERQAVKNIEAALYKDIHPENHAFTAQQFWDIEFASQKSGIVEEFKPGAVSSPSGQGRVDAFGKAHAISSHEQILNGQIFLGSKFPANKTYRAQVEEAVAKIGKELANQGFIGDFGVDFIMLKTGALIAIEINLRRGGTSHPQYTLRGLKKTPLDQAVTDTFYMSTDNLESPALKNYSSPHQLLNDPQVKPLLYDFTTGTGVVFHNMASHRVGKIGFTAYAPTRKAAQELYDQMTSILSE